MLCNDFIDRVKSKNSTFEKSSSVDGDLPDFYQRFNPKNVYFEFDDMDIHLLSIEEIKSITKEYYAIDCDFVFALSNSDPIFSKDKKIYTCAHGSKHPKVELVADSFEDYMKMIIESEE